MRIRSLICVMTSILAVSCTYDYVREASDKCVPEEFSAKIGDMANLRGSWKMGETVSVFSKSGTGNYLYDTSEDTFRKLDAVGRRQYASTFAGFYPADTPKYSVICVLFTKPTRQPLYGGKLPTQTVKKFIEEIENLR